MTDWGKDEDIFQDIRNAPIVVWMVVTMYTFVTIKLHIRFAHFTVY